ncbi:hypothetical protein [Arthrobacter sp. 18067]|uniref:hypothetical protein n=1 Tax=Arthrobacter sp. 18067 TaxID=2681413 RepID=UPI00135AC74F|nr:hypothetical protein [Arthrobacter sp. 18067]
MSKTLKNVFKPSDKVAEGLGATAVVIGVVVLIAAIVFGIWLLLAWLGIWLVGILTAGAVVLNIWQGVAAVALLSIIGGLISRK